MEQDLADLLPTTLILRHSVADGLALCASQVKKRNKLQKAWHSATKWPCRR